MTRPVQVKGSVQLRGLVYDVHDVMKSVVGQPDLLCLGVQEGTEVGLVVGGGLGRESHS